MEGYAAAKKMAWPQLKLSKVDLQGRLSPAPFVVAKSGKGFTQPVLAKSGTKAAREAGSAPRFEAASATASAACATKFHARNWPRASVSA